MAGPLLDAPGPGYRQMSEAVVGTGSIRSMSYRPSNGPSGLEGTLVLPHSASEKPVSAGSSLLEGKGDFKLQLGSEKLVR